MARALLLLSATATLSILAGSTEAFAADCYVDSVAGSDTNDGLTEATAWMSPSKIDSSCTTAKFKRGSEFAVAKGAYALDLMTLRNLKVLTNYGDPSQPLPKFVKQREESSGGMLASYMGGVTIDGLYLSGSQSDAQMSNLADGICLMLGANSKLINSEITLCDIGIMTMGENVQVLNNYVHDLFISVDGDPGIDPNAVGGAEGIFVNSSHVEVAYNRFINCTIPARWVSGTSTRCDGGATEVSVAYAGEVTDVRIHHNLSYNSCGFFEVASMFQPQGDTGPYVKGRFTDSIFYDNVMIDSGWISLLQINNTKLSNVHWVNNTIVHHDLGTDEEGTNLNDFSSSRIIALPFNDTSSGVTGGGEISPGDIYWTNNLWYFDPAVPPLPTENDEFLQNVIRTNNLILTEDPGFVDITATTDASAFDLLPGSQAVDQGAPPPEITGIAEITSDFLDRPAPVGAAPDVGAFEYQQGAAPTGGAGGTGGSSTGGDTPTGGETTVGGSPPEGGNPAVGGSPPVGGEPAVGGSPPSGGGPAVGGEQPVGGTASGGASPTGGSDTATGGNATTGGNTAIGGGPAGGEAPQLGGTSGTDVTGGTSGTGETGGGTTSLTCGASLDLCGNECVNLATDPSHCGSCENVCAADLVCSAGTCTTSCTGGTELCGQSCVNLDTDVLNCGACGEKCAGGQTCIDRKCTGTANGMDPTVPVEVPSEDSGDSSEKAGCGCIAAGSGPDGRGALVGLVLGLAVLARRKRRAR